MVSPAKPNANIARAYFVFICSKMLPDGKMVKPAVAIVLCLINSKKLTNNYNHQK
jgi:hypothetical protein